MWWHSQAVRQEPAKLPYPSSNLGATYFIMLYLIATPIGNLGDFTFRAGQVIQECDYLLCEDTRHSRKLLDHYQLRKPLYSYHAFNEASKADGIIADLKAGKTIGLLSDAGTPSIADPGLRLVKRCKKEGIKVSAIPGACAAIMALILSGEETERFQFIGFLPVKKGARARLLEEALTYPGTTVAYESPHRLLSTLEILHTLAPEHPLTIARELTKTFEEVVTAPPSVFLERWKQKKPKGEYVFVIPSTHSD